MGRGPCVPTVLPGLPTNGVSAVARSRPPRELAVHTAECRMLESTFNRCSETRYGTFPRKGVLAQPYHCGIRSTWSIPTPRSHHQSALVAAAWMFLGAGPTVESSTASPLTALRNSGRAQCAAQLEITNHLCTLETVQRPPDNDLRARVRCRTGLLIRAPPSANATPRNITIHFQRLGDDSGCNLQ
jgi:hypothetical protein